MRLMYGVTDQKDSTPSPPLAQKGRVEDGPDVHPCIAELLRTGYYPHELILRVERISDVPISASPLISGESFNFENNGDSRLPKRRAFRVFLGDGELVMQALLASALHRFVLSGRMREGMVVRVEDYEIKRAKRVGGRIGEVIYLAVGWFEKVGKQNTIGQVVVENRDDETIRNQKSKNVSKEFRVDREFVPSKRVKFALGSDTDERTTPSGDEFDEFDEFDDDDEFDHLMNQTVEPATEKKSQKLEDSFGMRAESFSELAEHIEEENRTGNGSEFKEENSATSRRSGSSALRPNSQPHGNERTQQRNTFFSTQPLRPVERPLNVLSLSDLAFPYKPLPKRNYLCDVFAVITWVSPNVIKRQHMAPKRDLRILDPTVEQRRPRGMQVSVFADAAGFYPAVGTIALLRSLKTHEWDGVSLNAYEKDCLGREWFITDPAKLKGYDVVGMKSWWERREKEKEKESTGETSTSTRASSQVKPG